MSEDSNKVSKALEKVFAETSDFILIGLTGRTGSGCSTTAKILSSETLDLPGVDSCHFIGNERRKYRIIKKYIDERWTPFQWLRVRSVITGYIVRLTFVEFVRLISETIGRELAETRESLDGFREEYEAAWDRFRAFEALPETTLDEVNSKKEQRFDVYFRWLPEFGDKISKVLNELADGGYTKVYQAVGDNIRASGHASQKIFSEEKLFGFPEEINLVVKAARYVARKEGKPCYVVIDAIRNPYEAVYLRERYSDFHLISVNTDNRNRLDHLRGSHKFTDAQIKELDDKEYPKSLKGHQRYVSQNIQKCIETADIHINNPRKDKFGNSELTAQLSWYVALMMHPGLVMPTSVESCMQIAYTVKQSSGCISRQVGAVVTDERYSVKAVGWNNTPQGQVPCLLRSAEDLLTGADEGAYSFYERNDAEFREVLERKFGEHYKSKALKGRSLPFCFKDLQNEVESEKNQVHTRSLHAEENAFLQISKFGGQKLEGGILFTTASPCELCAKKAYQLGISLVIYIDPYPGIATSHILNSGDRAPELQLFRGAVGRAYFKLYQPIMPFKDEIEMLLSVPKVSNKKDMKIKSLQTENDQLKDEIAQLKAKLERLSG